MATCTDACVVLAKVDGVTMECQTYVAGVVGDDGLLLHGEVSP